MKVSRSVVDLPSRLRGDYYLARALRNSIADHAKSWRVEGFARIVDFGCGAVPYFDLLSPVCGEYLGCDLKGSGAEIEFDQGGDVPVESASAGLVVSFQVLEHVEDVAWYFREAKRMLLPDGLLLLSTHGTWPYHPHPHDYRRWTREGLELELTKNGFTIQSSAALVGPGAWTLMFQFGAVALLMEKLGPIGRAAASGLNWMVSFVLPLADRVTPIVLRQNNSSVYVMLARSNRRDHEA